jgi:hypothetical protein
MNLTPGHFSEDVFFAALLLAVIAMLSTFGPQILKDLRNSEEKK